MSPEKRVHKLEEQVELFRTSQAKIVERIKKRRKEYASFYWIENIGEIKIRRDGAWVLDAEYIQEEIIVENPSLSKIVPLYAYLAHHSFFREVMRTEPKKDWLPVVKDYVGRNGDPLRHELLGKMRKAIVSLG